MTIPQFKRDFQLDNNTGDDIHTTSPGAENLNFLVPGFRLRQFCQTYAPAQDQCDINRI